MMYLRNKFRTIWPYIYLSRVMEHVPRWLQNIPINVRSIKLCWSTTKHIIKTRHRIIINTAFKTLYKNCINYSKIQPPLTCIVTVCRNFKFALVILKSFHGFYLVDFEIFKKQNALTSICDQIGSNAWHKCIIFFFRSTPFSHCSINIY